jgi:hypothetical protein
MKVINRKTVYLEAVLLALLSLLLLLFIDPLHLTVKLMFSVGIIASLITLYTVKFFIIWREKPQDERDLSHRYRSSWAAYTVGSLLLFVGIIVESFQGGVDEWLLISLAGMFIAKLVSMLYLEMYK